MTADPDGPLAALRKLAELGVRIAIDDFGTGYSNLAYLRRLPVHDLKLAGVFLDGLRDPEHADPADLHLVTTLIHLAHGLDLTVTAEAVETAGAGPLAARPRRRHRPGLALRPADRARADRRGFVASALRSGRGRGAVGTALPAVAAPRRSA